MTAGIVWGIAAWWLLLALVIVRLWINGNRREREAEAADARRYRYLRSRDLNAVHRGGLFAGKTPENIVINGVDLDRRCDVAIAEEIEV